MSKKDRLKREKEKQLLAKKKEEVRELERKENFKESKAVKKYKKKKDDVPEHQFFLVSKLLMLVPFGWSSFWGGVMSIAILMELANEYEFTEFSRKTALLIILGIAVMAGALVLEFMKKYIVGFVVSLGGVILYLKGVNQFINPIDTYLETHIVKNLEGYTHLWKVRCYPVAAFAVISLVILGVSLSIKYVQKRKLQKKLDNAPVKSIVSD